MRIAVALLALVIGFAGCSLDGPRQFENHFISMNETIADEHVQYSNGSLTIDGEQIALPSGETLNVSYRKSPSVTRYTVKVDSITVADVEVMSET